MARDWEAEWEKYLKTPPEWGKGVWTPYTETEAFGKERESYYDELAKAFEERLATGKRGIARGMEARGMYGQPLQTEYTLRAERELGRETEMARGAFEREALGKEFAQKMAFAKAYEDWEALGAEYALMKAQAESQEGGWWGDVLGVVLGGTVGFFVGGPAGILPGAYIGQQVLKDID